MPERSSQSAPGPSALRDEQTDLYGFLFSNARDIMLFLETDGRVVEANKAAIAAYGYTREELLSLTIYDLRSGQTAPEITSQMTSADALGLLFETVHRRKDGSLFPVEVSSQGAELSGRRMLLSVVRDITERKRVAQTVAAHERRYQTLFTQLVEAFAVHEIVLDEDGRPIDYRFLDVNPAFETMTGLVAKETIGKTVREVLPGIEQHWIDTYGRVALTGETVRFESYSAPLGRRYEVAAFRPAEGQFATLFFDVTPRWIAEEKAQELSTTAQRRAAELEGVLDNMVDCVLVADLSGRLVLVNDAGMRLLGLESDQDPRAKSLRFGELVQARDRSGDPVPDEALPLSRALAGETVEAVDLIIYNAGSGRDAYTRTNASPIRDPEGRVVGAVALMRDVSDLTAFDQMKDQFITVAAHELKTPVAIMKGYAQLLLRQADNLTERHRGYLLAINRGSDRMNRVVGNLLEVSRFQLGNMIFHKSAIRLDDLVRSVVRQFSPLASSHAVRALELAESTVMADESRLEQVLLALLDNAVRYSPSGTDVTVELTNCRNEARVTVRDGGVGIAEDKQQRVFDPFYRAHTGTAWDYGGMGVGLYLAREIVTGHGGRMWFDSQERVGSAFHFALPLEAQRAGS